MEDYLRGPKGKIAARVFVRVRHHDGNPIPMQATRIVTTTTGTISPDTLAVVTRLLREGRV